MSNGFKQHETYENVFLVFIDAAGHSNIVKKNPRDKAIRGFDLLYDKIVNRMNSESDENRCEISTVWSWLGDGGLFALFDKNESHAVKTAITFAKNILDIDLPNLRTEFKKAAKINGDLHIRIAIHKGTIRFTDEGQQGHIHSPDINWGAHLEKVTLQDCLGISKDVYDVLPQEEQVEFVHVGKFEDRETYMFSTTMENNIIRRDWIATQGFDKVHHIQGYCERISERDKAALIGLANKSVIDFGTTLRTCSNYLFTTTRPLMYRNAVCGLLQRGGTFECYMLAPESSGAQQLSELRMEDTNQKLKESIKRFKEFKSTEITDGFDVYQFEHNPNFAAMFIDPDGDDAICLYSPYLSSFSKDEKGLGRADMPHYLVSKQKNYALYQSIWEYVKSYINAATKIDLTAT